MKTKNKFNRNEIYNHYIQNYSDELDNDEINEYIDKIELIHEHTDNDIEFLSEVKEFYNHSTVPIIVENDIETGETSFIGGFSELNGVLDLNRMCTITYK